VPRVLRRRNGALEFLEKSVWSRSSRKQFWCWITRQFGRVSGIDADGRSRRDEAERVCDTEPNTVSAIAPMY
jgi:hypothetical protein